MSSLPRKKTNNYINNKEFLAAIVEYRKAVRKAKREGVEKPRMPEYIGKCIKLIAENLSLKPCFINYSFRDEMIQDGIENCILYFDNYDPKVGANPFAYFTQVNLYAFIRRISKEERFRYILYKNFHTLQFDDGDFGLMPPQMYDNIATFMNKFERKEEEKRKKQRKAKTQKKNLQKLFEE